MTELPKKTVRIEIPQRFMFLLDMIRYKVGYGGRGGLKSWSFARAILVLGAAQRLRVVVGREVMKTLKDSAHKLFSDQIRNLDLGDHYTVMESEIRGANGTEISYTGLGNQTAETIKSFESVDIFWVEEAEGVAEKSWQILLPTIRAPNSEVWISFNPDLVTSATYQRWVVNPPPGARVVFSDYKYAQACGLFDQEQENLRQHDQKTLPKEDYENIWDGKPRSALKGAIFTSEVGAMIQEGRYRPTPYDPRLPVHTIWDLGWNDAMSILMVQKPTPTVINVINYLEDNQKTYAEYVQLLKNLRYNWGDDWLPADGEAKDPKSGKSARMVLKGLGRRARLMFATNPPIEETIRNARMLFPRVYMDNSKHETDSGHLGCERLMECLRRYARKVPDSTDEPGAPIHDQYSHGASTWRYLAQIADRITNDTVEARGPTMAPYHQPVQGMGVLG